MAGHVRNQYPSGLIHWFYVLLPIEYHQWKYIDELHETIGRNVITTRNKIICMHILQDILLVLHITADNKIGKQPNNNAAKPLVKFQGNATPLINTWPWYLPFFYKTNLPTQLVSPSGVYPLKQAHSHVPFTIVA